MISIRPFARCNLATTLLLVSALMGLANPTAYALESLFGSGPTPLSPEEAFKPSIETISGNQVEIRFDIADEYYLYEKRFNFSTESTEVTVGDPSFPKALVHEDEYFGKSNIFRDNAIITVPVTSKGAATEFDLTVGYQGCADMGLCYPPTKTSLKIALPASTMNATAPVNIAQNNSNNLKALITKDKPALIPLPELDLPATQQNAAAPGKVNLNDLFDKPTIFNNSDSDTLLGPSEAFVPSILEAGDNQITLRWFIEPGYYLYRDKISFSLADAGDASVVESDIDRGVMQNDAYFGNVEILREVPGARITLTNAQNLTNATLKIQSQGCADIGVCFPPEVTTLPVTFNNTGVAAAIANASDGTPSAESRVDVNAATAATAADSASLDTASNTTALPETEQNKLTRLLEGGHLGLIALAFYIAGLLLAFTACMYPMIPILSSLIVGHGANIGAGKAFSLSLVYVLSMASVFALVGVLVGLSGYNIQPLFQNPWVLSAFAALFVLLALSMFGLYQLQMPSSIQSRMTELSNKQKGGSWSGVAIMGVLSALIVGPCVTPPLVAALAYIANTGDARIGGIALFAIGIGMGTPLLFIGTSLGRFMPKAGGWMETTQRIFGIILLAVAIYMLSRFLPANVIMIMCAMLAIFSGVYFGATDRLDQDSQGTQRFGKSIGLVALVYGVVLMVGALAGNTSLLAPLKGVVGQQAAVNGQQAENAHLTFQRIKTTADLDKVLAEAKALNRPVMLDFYADWCISCKEMEAFTFPDKRVKEQLADAILIQADVTKNDDADKSMLKKFNLFGPPAIILYDRSGNELTAGRVVGFMNADKFSTHLQAYLNGPI